jgi:glutaminyl-tRNA synthetase
MAGIFNQIYNETKVRPRQYEFARLNLNYTVMSKRKLQLVQRGQWMDDPRMPTISGLRRRIYRYSIPSFVKSGVAKRENVMMYRFEFCLREI